MACFLHRSYRHAGGQFNQASRTCFGTCAALTVRRCLRFHGRAHRLLFATPAPAPAISSKAAAVGSGTIVPKPPGAAAADWEARVRPKFVASALKSSELTAPS